MKSICQIRIPDNLFHILKKEKNQISILHEYNDDNFNK